MSKPNKNGDLFPNDERYPTVSMGMPSPVSGCVICADWSYDSDFSREWTFEPGGTINKDGTPNFRYITLVKKLKK